MSKSNCCNSGINALLFNDFMETEVQKNILKLKNSKSFGFE